MPCLACREPECAVAITFVERVLECHRQIRARTREPGVSGTSCFAEQFGVAAVRQPRMPDPVPLPPAHPLGLGPAVPQCGEASHALQQTVPALARLPEAQRAALVLIALDFSYGEAARILEVPLGTLMSRLARGREALRRTMSEDGSPRLHVVGDRR